MRHRSLRNLKNARFLYEVAIAEKGVLQKYCRTDSRYDQYTFIKLCSFGKFILLVSFTAYTSLKFSFKTEVTNKRGNKSDTVPETIPIKTAQKCLQKLFLEFLKPL